MIGDLEHELGPMSTAEKRVAMVFLVVVLLWITRGMLTSLPGLSGLTDTGIVMAAALILFVVPSGSSEGGPLMTWPDLRALPWGVLILFGGGLALAAQVSSSGLAGWLGESLSPLSSMGVIALVLASAGLVVFLTELTSNLATAATFLPVIAAIALSANVDPLVLCVPVTLAASCAFMLPVATPPNAIVYSSGVLRIADNAARRTRHEPAGARVAHRGGCTGSCRLCLDKARTAVQLARCRGGVLSALPIGGGDLTRTWRPDHAQSADRLCRGRRLRDRPHARPARPESAPQPLFEYEAINHPVMGTKGMVASRNALASEVGARILREGGNAIDASAAVGFALR